MLQNNIATVKECFFVILFCLFSFLVKTVFITQLPRLTLSTEIYLLLSTGTKGAGKLLPRLNIPQLKNR